MGIKVKGEKVAGMLPAEGVKGRIEEGGETELKKVATWKGRGEGGVGVVVASLATFEFRCPSHAKPLEATWSLPPERSLTLGSRDLWRNSIVVWIGVA